MKQLVIIVAIIGQGLFPLLATGTDSLLVEYIKKEKFSLEIYELAFSIEEVLKTIEDDSVYRKVFEKRLVRAFNKRLNESQIYLHEFELSFLKQRLTTIKNVKKSYPNSFALINNLVYENSTSFNNYAIPFQNCIEYPDQVDVVCVATLVLDFPDRVWTEIQANKIALYRFNSWLEFGFEEFRYYPGTKTKAKAILNQRIIEFIQRKHKGNKHPLVVESLEMINKVVNKYNK